MLLAGCGEDKPKNRAGGSVFKVDGIAITKSEKSILPVSKKKELKANMTLRRAVEVLGAGYCPPYSDMAQVSWTFDDKSTIYFYGVPTSGNIDKKLKLVSKDQWEIDNEFK